MENITTRSRRLEQFFYDHGVDFTTCTKDEEGMTVWQYPATAENLRILSEFRTAKILREQQKGE